MNIENQKLLAKYSGLSYGGVNEEGEIQFIGTKKEWDIYDKIMDSEVLEDRFGKYIFIGKIKQYLYE